MENRIYAVVAGTIQTGVPGSRLKNVVQPLGRQVAQVAHVVSKLRHYMALDIDPGAYDKKQFEPVTTIVLQARDSKELVHVADLLHKRKVEVTLFMDDNPEYGSGRFTTAICTEPVEPKRVQGILDYLPLWGAQ
jgi:hypothetical protein